MTRRVLPRLGVSAAFIVLVLVAPARQSSAQAQTAPPAKTKAAATTKKGSLPRTTWGAPDLQGVWSTATVTPMERPKDLANKEKLTDEEAAQYAEQIVSRRNVDKRSSGNSDVTSAYNDLWYDRGTKVIPGNRTSLIVDPADGRVPALTPAGRSRAANFIPSSGYQDQRILNSWLDRGLWERCITRGVPEVMLPTAYNNNYQIFQTRDYVAILAEMIHDVRIIPLDGRPHPGDVRQWMGSSTGHWEGDTLVVDTANFSDKTSFRGAGANLHLVERFRRVDADTLDYEVTVSDPTTFTAPWTIDLPATKADGRIYEYACHEGNYAMEHALSGSRAREKELAEAAKKSTK